jgi:basic membrane lipoprotein Med (substrate-binding protein (PBP1-ABC) superfamily)
MATIVLLSCTKSKLDKPSQAQDLYSASPMFQKTLEYGKSLRPDKMYILSAKHFLVPLTKVLAPYDKTLKEMPKDEKEAWGEKVISQIKSAGINIEKDKLIFLTGSEYMKPLLKYIPEGNIEKPMEGRRMGERLQWLNSQIAKLHEVIKRIKNIVYEYFKK